MSNALGLLVEENFWEFLFNHVNNQSQSELNGHKFFATSMLRLHVKKVYVHLFEDKTVNNKFSSIDKKWDPLRAFKTSTGTSNNYLKGTTNRNPEITLRIIALITTTTIMNKNGMVITFNTNFEDSA